MNRRESIRHMETYGMADVDESDMDMGNRPFPASRLAELVRSRGYSTSSVELADRCGITRKRLYQLCTDSTCNPAWQTVGAVLDALGATWQDLVAE